MDTIRASYVASTSAGWPLASAKNSSIGWSSPLAGNAPVDPGIRMKGSAQLGFVGKPKDGPPAHHRRHLPAYAPSESADTTQQQWLNNSQRLDLAGRLVSAMRAFGPTTLASAN